MIRLALALLLVGCTLDADGDGVATPEDCDDADPLRAPGLPERCDGVDGDCDGRVDVSDTPFEGSRPLHRDDDDDLWGNPVGGVHACPGIALDGWVPNADDCDDGDASQHPGAAELCNGEDDDCDGRLDDEDPDRLISDTTIWYRDRDDDGVGRDDIFVRSCKAPDGHVDRGGDCNDEDPDRSPDLPEVCGGSDEDCDGLVDDEDPSLLESSAIVRWPDRDRDGWGDETRRTLVCDPQTLVGVWVPVGGDCHDGRADVNPDGAEVCGGVDEDCDGLWDDDDPSVDPEGFTTWWPDVDGDGSGDAEGAPRQACGPAGYAPNADDCDDTRADIGPHVDDTLCDGIASDCGDRDEWLVDVDVAFADLPEVVEDGDLVCLGFGSYEGNLRLDAADDVRIVGQGPSRTSWIPARSDLSVGRFGDRTRVEHLAVRGVGDPVRNVFSGNDLHLEDVHFEHLNLQGIIGGQLVDSWSSLIMREVEARDIDVIATAAPAGAGRNVHLFHFYGGAIAGGGGPLVVEGLTVDDVRVQYTNGATITYGEVLRGDGGNATIRDVHISDVEIAAPDSQLSSGCALLLDLEGTSVVEDVTVHDVVLETAGSATGVGASIRATGPGTTDVRRIDIRDVRVETEDALRGAGLSVLQGTTGVHPMRVRHVVVAGVEALVDSDAPVNGGLLQVGASTRLQDVSLQHVTLAGSWIARTAPQTGDIAIEGAAAWLKGPSLDGAVIVDVSTNRPGSPVVAGPTVSPPVVGASVVVPGDLTPPEGALVLAEASAVGFVSYDPATDPMTWDLHLLPTSPAVDHAWELLPPDADGSPADAGAYGGPGGDW